MLEDDFLWLFGTVWKLYFSLFSSIAAYYSSNILIGVSWTLAFLDFLTTVTAIVFLFLLAVDYTFFVLIW